MGQCAHLRNYVRLPDCEVVALAELRPGLAREVAAHYGVPSVYQSHAELLANEQLDGIVASQQFQLHGSLMPELAQTGVPVFMEKPLAASLAAGERIVAAFRQSGNWAMVGYHKRSDPATAYAKAEIERLKASGELGDLRYVRITMPPGDWIAGGFDDFIGSDEARPELQGDPPPDDMDAETYGQYQGFVNYYIHQVNLLRHLLGEPYRVTHADPSGVLLVAQSESGVPGLLEMAPYHTSIDWQESALIGFQRGWIRLELPPPVASYEAGRVSVYRDPGDGETPQTLAPEMPRVHAMKQQAANFLKAIRGESEPLCRVDEALEDLRVAREYIRLIKEAP